MGKPLKVVVVGDAHTAALRVAEDFERSGYEPAVFLALFQPTWKLLVVIGWYAFIQQVESNFVVPRVMRASVGLSPLLTIIALVVGARLLGAAGALLAVPVAAALQVVVGELVRRYGPRD